jgi:Ca2+-binding RTX toxin-like protein
MLRIEMDSPFRRIAALTAVLATVVIVPPAQATIAGIDDDPGECAGEPVTVTTNDDGEPIGDGDDVLAIFDDPNRIVVNLQGGDDRIFSGEGDDLICGADGKDVVIGHIGDDVVYGGEGSDFSRGTALPGLESGPRVVGGLGDDVLYGGPGRDALNGSRGDDRLFGEAGRDLLRGGAGKDNCNGGPGKDDEGSCEKTKSIP